MNVYFFCESAGVAGQRKSGTDLSTGLFIWEEYLDDDYASAL